MIVVQVTALLVTAQASQSKPHDVWVLDGFHRQELATRLCTLKSTKVLPHRSAGPWVPAWGGFAIVDRGRLYAVDREGKIEGPKGVIGPDWGVRSMQWAVSPDGTLLAEFDMTYHAQSIFVIRELATGKTVVKLDSQVLTARLGRAKGDISLEGVTWSPNGDRVAFGHAFGTPVDLGGVAMTRIGICTVRSREVRNFSKSGKKEVFGAPRAWVGSDRLLVDGFLDVAIVGASGPLVRRNLSAKNLAWNGKEVVMLRSYQGEGVFLERWRSDLESRRSRVRVRKLQWADANSGFFVAPLPEAKR